MSSKKSKSIQLNGFIRGLRVSVAGARTGGAMLADGALNKLIPSRESSSLLKKEALKFAEELGRLKGTYTKIGQMLALLGEHFLPVEITDALHTLESQTHSLPWGEIKILVKERLGDRYDELDIETKPLATASMAQVHRAKIKSTDEQICLKILYPGVKESIDHDFNTVVRMLTLTRIVKISKEINDWLDSVRAQLHQEVDYDLEIATTNRMADLLIADSRYKVPKVYKEYCSSQLIALEYIDGVSVGSKEVADLSLKKRNQLAKSMLDLFFHEIYQWGLIQTDPNFGNYLVSINEYNDQLVLLDFGSVIETSLVFNSALGATIHAGQLGDRDGVIKGLIALKCLKSDSSLNARNSFAEFCIDLLEPLKKVEQLPQSLLNASGEYRWGTSDLLKRVGKNAAKSTINRDFTLPSQEFAFIARKLTGVFTFITVLNAEFNGEPLLLKHWQSSKFNKSEQDI